MTETSRTLGFSCPWYVRHWPELLLCLVAAATLRAIIGISLNHDVNWQIWVARQILQGRLLYRDIWEVNPPLWFWSAVPIVSIAGATAIPPSQILISIVTIMGTLSALTIGALGNFETALRRAIVMLLCFAAMVTLPLVDFAQREQLALIVALPYAALIARRREGMAIPVVLALAIGLCGAYGFVLKHYFLAIPILLEVWLLTSRPRFWSPVRPETAALTFAGLAYSAALLLWARQFFTDMLPLILTAYRGYDAPLAYMLDRPHNSLWLLGITALIIGRRMLSRDGNPLVVTLTLTAAGFFFAYAVQMKGPSYHALSVTGALLAALAVLVTSTRHRAFAIRAIVFAAFALAVFHAFARGEYRNPFQHEVEPALSGIPRGKAVAILAVNPMYAWPLVERQGLLWPLRFSSYWTMPAIANVDGRKIAPAVIHSLKILTLRQTREDLRCGAPMVILLQRVEPSRTDKGRSFDMGGLFLSDPGIASLLRRQYIEQPYGKAFLLFRRKGSPRFIRPSSCSQTRPILS